MANIYSWNTDAAQNANSDSAIDWSEGMAPSGVNDSARFMMARIAELLTDLGGALEAAGSANAIAMTAESAFTAYDDGQIIAFRAVADNTGATTLNVNNVGAKPLVKMARTGEASLAGGDIQDTGIYVARYSTELNSANGAWLLLNPTVENVETALAGLSLKTTPVDADSVAIVDSAASDVGKRVTWANVKATLKTYLDTLYAPVVRTISTSGLASGGGSLAANRTIDVPVASQAEATAGSSNAVAMTPLRTQQAMDGNVYTGTSVNNADFPIGTSLPVEGIFNSPVGTALNVFVRSDEITYCANSGSSNGTQLLGSWRKRGSIANGVIIAERVS